MRFGAKATLIPGLVAILGGLLLFARVPVDGEYVTDVLPSAVLFGVGAGVSFPSMVTLAMSGATPSDSGLASGLVNTTQQVGGALGLSLLATLSATRSDGLIEGGQATSAALTEGYQLAFATAAGLVAVAIVIAAVVLRRPEQAAALDTDEVLAEERILVAA
jgi:MFS family permease